MAGEVKSMMVAVVGGRGRLIISIALPVMSDGGVSKLLKFLEPARVSLRVLFLIKESAMEFPQSTVIE